eukprot:9123236-Ditylum_brightwellii.AAC.1
MKEMFMKLAYICCNIFNFVGGGVPWDPNVTPPFNDVSFVYVVTVSVFNSTYKRSPNKISAPVPATAPALFSPPVHALSCPHAPALSPPTPKDDNYCIDLNADLSSEGSVFDAE